MGNLIYHEAAESLVRRSLEGRERTLGPEHPDTLTSLNVLGVLLRSKNDHEGAELYLRKHLETLERLKGADAKDVLEFKRLSSFFAIAVDRKNPPYFLKKS